MPPVPDPLHPAVVHFPIVLLLLGAPLAVLAAFVPRFARLSALVLALGAAGALVAVQTGEREKHDEIAVPEGEGKTVLRAHEDHGESARNAALAAAALAIAGAVSRRFSLRRTAVLFTAAAALAALLAAWQVGAAGHTGGALVYLYGVGLRF